MTLLKPQPEVQARQLLWDPDSRRFLGELSDLGGSFGRVYDDSIDEGLTLVSRYPGTKDIVFVVGHVERDRERDILWWDLVPADLAQRKSTTFTVRIFND